MTTGAILAALYALRAQVDALIVALDGRGEMVDPSVCTHPEEKQVDATVAGGGSRRTFCLACNTERDA